jgi:hypothetical protein
MTVIGGHVPPARRRAVARRAPDISVYAVDAMASAGVCEAMINIFVCSPHPQIRTYRSRKWSPRIQSEQA